MRQEPRVNLVLPVEISADQNMIGSESSFTYEVSHSGARLKRVRDVVVGQEIWLQRNNSKAKYRVAWIGRHGTPEASQMGVELLEDKFIWEDELQRWLAEPAE
jgi:hypothetical protein